MDTFYCSNSYIFPLALYLFIGLSDKKNQVILNLVLHF